MLMFKFINCSVNYGVVLILVVVSLMAGSTTGVPMSPGYGGYQTATPPPYCTTTYATAGYYTEDPKYPKYYSAPSYYTEAPIYYTTEAPEYYTTKAPEYYTTTYAAPTHRGSQVLHR
jgi:hypothetical protein